MKRLPSRSRHLRLQTTAAEEELWRHVRGRRLGGFKFRRQHPIGRFVVDFYCYEAALAVEVDGGHHNRPEQEQEDQRRTASLRALGIEVVRVWNHEVWLQREAVLMRILLALESRPSVPG